MSLNTASYKAVLLSVLMMPSVATLGADSKSGGKSESGEFSASVNISEKATAGDVGLPLYRGASPYVSEGNDSSAVSMGFKMGSIGPKLIVASYQSPDGAEKVAAFYKEALKKYGPVLDCSDPREQEKTPTKSGLTCDSDSSGSSKDAFKFKAGKKDEQRIVAIQTRGSKTTFSLVYLNIKGLTD